RGHGQGAREEVADGVVRRGAGVQGLLHDVVGRRVVVGRVVPLLAELAGRVDVDGRCRDRTGRDGPARCVRITDAVLVDDAVLGVLLVWHPGDRARREGGD